MERIYETMFIVVPTLDEEERENVVKKVQDFIQERLEGKIDNVDRWGIRKLAFKVKKFTEGDYTVILFRASPEKLNQLENFYHITQEIFRWQTFRREDLEKKERKKQREDSLKIAETNLKTNPEEVKTEESTQEAAVTSNTDDIDLKTSQE